MRMISLIAVCCAMLCGGGMADDATCVRHHHRHVGKRIITKTVHQTACTCGCGKSRCKCGK